MNLPLIALALLPVLEEPQARLVETRKIWDQAPHSAFTDLARFQDRWYCCFREGRGHVSEDGTIRVLTSVDGKDWRSAAHLAVEGSDLRDPKLSVTPEGRLMALAAASPAIPADGGHQPVAFFSANGRDWSKPIEIGEKGVWLWRVSWHDGRGYGVGYPTGREAPRGVRLYRSTDATGDRFEVLVPDLFHDGFPNESAIRFDSDGTAYCLLRRDGEGAEGSGQLGRARPPYTSWTWIDLGIRIGGPNLLRLPDGRWIAGVRLHAGETRTAICSVDPAAGTIQRLLTLPSSGDSSYPGLVWHEGELWVSYYSSHEGKASIYLARVVFED